MVWEGDQAVRTCIVQNGEVVNLKRRKWLTSLCVAGAIVLAGFGVAAIVGTGPSHGPRSAVRRMYVSVNNAYMQAEPQSTPTYSGFVPPSSTSTMPGESEIQSMFTGFSSGNYSALKTDASTAASFQRVVETQRSLQVIPTVVTSTTNANGTMAVEFTVKVYADGALFPTPSIGTLSANVNPDGAVSMTPNALCHLVSPLFPTCPFSSAS